MLIGLSKRQPLCKICTCFKDDMLNEITLDLLFVRKTYDEIKETYNQYLPAGVDLLNSANLVNHRNHSDPALVAEEALRRRGEAVSDSDFAAVLYAERFNERIDKQTVLHSLYKNRINSIQFLRDLLKDKQVEYTKLRSEFEKDSTNFSFKSKLKLLENEIKVTIKQIDDIESDIQSTVLQDLKVEKGPGNTYINQNIVNVMEGGYKDFLGEFIPYLLHDVFKNDIDKGKEVVAHLSSSMDTYLSPALKMIGQERIK